MSSLAAVVAESNVADVTHVFAMLVAADTLARRADAPGVGLYGALADALDRPESGAVAAALVSEALTTEERQPGAVNVVAVALLAISRKVPRGHGYLLASLAVELNAVVAAASRSVTEFANSLDFAIADDFAGGDLDADH